MLRPNASPSGGWSDSDLTASGLYVRDIVRDWNVCVDASPVLLGDCNRNGVVDFTDITPMIELLSSGVFLEEGDCNVDGQMNFLDITPFIAILAGS